MEREKAIAVFDSGFGGLTVLGRLQKILPLENYIYLGDNLNSPYGEKSSFEIEQLSLANAMWLESKGIKALVIACNTASIYAYKKIKKYLSCPIYEITSAAVDTIANHLDIKRLGVIGTRATVHSGYYRKIIEKKNPSIEIYSKSCPQFVPMIEEGDIDPFLAEKVIKKYLRGLKENKIDTLLLGCTHYPLIKDLIQKELRDVYLIDPAEKLAKEVQKDFSSNKTGKNREEEGTSIYYTTGEKSHFSKIASIFLGEKIAKNVKNVFEN